MLKSFVCVLLASMGLAANAEEGLRFGPPPDYRIVVSDKIDDAAFRYVLIPKTQDPSAWEDMLTVNVFEKARDFNQNQMVRLSQALVRNCPDGRLTPVDEKMIWFECKESPVDKRFELNLLNLVRGKDKSYVLVKSFRRNPSGSERDRWVEFLSAASICRMEDKSSCTP
jgi:hypothetical protein